MRFRVVVTGAFSTGMPLRVRLGDYVGFQEEVGEALEKHGSGGWNHEGVKLRAGFTYGKGGGGYANLVPLVLVQREGEKVRERALAGGERPAGASEDWEWSLAEVTVQLYDLGAGVLSGVYDVTAPAGAAPKEVAESVFEWTALDPDGSGNVPPLAAAYQALSEETVETFREVVERCGPDKLSEQWLLGKEDGNSWPDGDMEPGRLLWLHPVFVLPAEPDAEGPELEALAAPFRSTYSSAVRYPDGLFVPGIQKSVIVVKGDFGLSEDPLGLTTLNWAYYTLLMEMDRGLLARLDDPRWDTRGSLPELEKGAEEAYRAHLRFTEARARLDSALTSLGPRRIHLWAPLAEVTRFEELVAGVEKKLEALRGVAEARVQEASARSSRRSRNALTLLTAFTLVTVVVAVIDSLLGSQTDRTGHDLVRIVALALAILGVVVVYLAAEWEMRWLRRYLRRLSKRQG